MIKLFTLAVCTGLAFVACAQEGTKAIKLLAGKFTMTAPTDADTMTAAQILTKYGKTPDNKTYYYGDKDLDFSIVIAIIAEGLKEADMVESREKIIAKFNAKGYKLEENKVQKINNHDILVFSFYSDVPGGKVFNKRFFAVAGGKLILVTFNCTESDQEKRKPQIEKSINSIIIK